MKYPKAIWLPGPPAKQNYGAYPSPQNKEGFVLHSAEGSLAGTLAELMKPEREASWHFTISYTGTVYQHYDIRAVCWHCGLAGDADTLTAAIGNVALIGIEHEGVAGQMLTAQQVGATIELQKWCYSVLSTLKAPALRSSHWEHGWLSGTSCPSGRIPWAIIITELKKGDQLSSAEFNQLKAELDALRKITLDTVEFVQFEGKPEVYRVSGNTLEHVENYLAFKSQAAEGTPGSVVTIKKGTPEWTAYTNMVAVYRTIPPAMTGA